MNKAEFDKFADDYHAMHALNVKASGESPIFFAEYKVLDTLSLSKEYFVSTHLKILDFGSGIGNSVPHFVKYFPNAQLTCADVSERSLEISNGLYPGAAEHTLFDGHQLPFRDNHFELIFSACVFHHIPDNEQPAVFQEIRRVLAADGILVIFEHNPRNPLTVRAVNSCPLDENAVLIDSRALANKFKEAGLIVRHIRYRIFFPRLFRRLRFLEQFIGWLPLGAQYYIVGKKNSAR